MSLWTTEEDWKPLLDEMSLWTQENKEGCFYWEQLQARREIEERTLLPWSLLVEDMHLRRRRALVLASRKAGLSPYPRAAEELELPVLRDWSVGLDGGGRTEKKKKSKAQMLDEFSAKLAGLQEKEKESGSSESDDEESE